MNKLLHILCLILIAATISGATFADDGLTPLHHAAANGNVAEAKLLISEGADINAKGSKGNTPLHYAADSGQTQIALALIKAGAYINAKNNVGSTPLHISAGFGQTETSLALINAGSDINAKDNLGGTPLHAAVVKGQTETMLTLVKEGANLFARTNDEYTPLDFAIGMHGKDSDIVRILQEEMKKRSGYNNQSERKYLIHFIIICAMLLLGHIIRTETKKPKD